MGGWPASAPSHLALPWHSTRPSSRRKQRHCCTRDKAGCIEPGPCLSIDANICTCWIAQCVPFRSDSHACCRGPAAQGGQEGQGQQGGAAGGSQAPPGAAQVPGGHPRGQGKHHEHLSWDLQQCSFFGLVNCSRSSALESCKDGA